MTQRHLGWRAGALGTGELTDDELARAWTHYRMCAWCREQVDGQREIRAELGKVSGPHIPPDVLSELYATPRWAAPPTAAPEPVPVGGGSHRPPRRRRTRSARRLAITTLGVVGLFTAAGLMSAFALGDRVLPAPEALRAARESAAVSAPREAVNSPHLADHAREETIAMLDWMASAGWSVPDSLPDGYYLSDFAHTASDEHALSVSIATPSGSVWLRLVHGRVDDGDLDGLSERLIGGRTVYCEDAGGQLAGVTNSGSELMAFVSNASDGDLAAVLANSPGPTTIAAGARIARGWGQIQAILS
jgi:hypothetical protein